MNKTEHPNKQTISGDYYEISKNGIYRRHTDVSIHCHHSQHNNTRKDKQVQGSMGDNPEKEEHKKVQPFMLKSRFSQNCKQILQKQQVNSIHEQDPLYQSQMLKMNNTDRRDKNANMRRSTQNQFIPKKGILKRSLIDKKEEEALENTSKADRSIHNNHDLYTQQQMSPAQPESQFQLQGEQPHRGTLSWINPSTSHSGKNSKNYHQARFGLSNNNISPLLARTARVQGERQQIQRINKVSNRQNTEGHETVAIKGGRMVGGEEHSDGVTEQMHCNFAFEKAVLQQIQFLNNKIVEMQKQLKQNEERRKQYELQKQLQRKKDEIERIRKQNEILKQNMRVPQCEKQNMNINLDSFEPIVKFVESKSTFIISFLVALLVCLMLGKSGTCSKS